MELMSLLSCAKIAFSRFPFANWWLTDFTIGLKHPNLQNYANKEGSCADMAELWSCTCVAIKAEWSWQNPQHVLCIFPVPHSVPRVVWWSQADACLHLIHNWPANFSFIIIATICFVSPSLTFIFSQVHKANPIRKYRSIEVKSSDQPLTTPRSPKFSDRFRCWWASTW